MDKPSKRILLVGAEGVIGRHVHSALKARHDVLCAGLDGTDVRLDLGDTGSVVDILRKLGKLDAIISTAGRARFIPLADIVPAALDASAYGLGLKDKLMGQVNLTLAAREVLTPGGSITLTSGTTSTDPIPGGSSLSMVNGALEQWVRAASTEMPDLRINIVSPSLVEGTPDGLMAAFPGFEVVSGHKVALAYLRCLESGLRGEVLRV